MNKAIPDEIDPLGFEANLDGCNKPLQEMVAYLRNTAQYGGSDVTTRRFKHPEPNTGWGITYYREGNGSAN